MGCCPSHVLFVEKRSHFLSWRPKESHTSGGKFCLISVFEALEIKRIKIHATTLRNSGIRDIIQTSRADIEKADTAMRIIFSTAGSDGTKAL